MNIIRNDIEARMPEGWWRAFGEELCKDIEEELARWPEDVRKEFCIFDIKEKWGGLRISTSVENNNLNKIFDRYEKFSKYICIRCGRPAMWMSKGWVSPYCDECAREKVSWNDKFIRINKEEEC